MAYPMDINTLEVQQFTESTWGTGGTATVRRRGITDFNLLPQNKTDRIEERRGTLVPAYLSRVVKTGANANESGVVLYQDSIYLWNGLFNFATASGAGPYTRDYAAPVAAVPTHKTYSLYYGDPADYAAYINGAVLNKLSFSGNAESYLTYKAEWLGKAGAAGAAVAQMVASASAPELASASAVIGADLTLYMDAWGGTVGTTALATSAFKWEFEVNGGREVRRYSGSTGPGALKYGRMDGALKLGLEVNTATATYITNLVAMSAEQQYQFRMKFYDGTNTMQIDFAGVAEETPQLFDQDNGSTFVNMAFKGKYNTALGNWLKVQSISGLSAVNLL